MDAKTKKGLIVTGIVVLGSAHCFTNVNKQITAKIPTTYNTFVKGLGI